MRRVLTLLALIAAPFLSGCVSAHPLVPVLSATAKALFDDEEEKKAGPITIDQLLSQARGGATKVSNAKPVLATFNFTGQTLDKIQKMRLELIAGMLRDTGVAQVSLIIGTAGTQDSLADTFHALRFGRAIGRALEHTGIDVHFVTDPSRSPIRVDIVADKSDEGHDA